MKKVGHTTELLLGICWWTWKTTFLLKKLLKWANKSNKYFDIYKNLKKENKIKKNTWRYHYFISMYQQSSWYDLRFLRYRMRQNQIGNCGSFFAFYSPLLKTPKIRILKRMKKNCWRYHHFTQVYQNLQSYEVQFLRCSVRQTKFFVILGHF